MCGGGGSNEVKETGAEKELARIAYDKFTQYRSMYPDIENEFFTSVDKLNSSSAINRAADSATTNVNAAYSQAVDNGVKQMTSSGIDPSSGRFRQAISDMNRDKQVATFDNANRTQQTLQDNYLQGKSNIVRMGHGLETEALQGFGQIASASGQNAIDSAYRSHNRRAGNRSAIATGVGAGIGMANRRSGVDPYGSRESGYSFSGDPFEAGDN